MLTTATLSCSHISECNTIDDTNHETWRGKKKDSNCSKTITIRRAATLIYTLPGRFTFIYCILASSLSDNIPSSVSVCAFTTRTSCINISNRKRTYIRALSPISNQYVAFPPDPDYRDPLVIRPHKGIQPASATLQCLSHCC